MLLRVTITRVVCDVCGAPGPQAEDSSEAVKEALERGWQVCHRWCCCPDHDGPGGDEADACLFAA